MERVLAARRILRLAFVTLIVTTCGCFVPPRACGATETPQTATALNRSRAMEAVEEAVRMRESAKRHRVSSVVLTETSTGPGTEGYQSTWDVVVRHSLDYSGPAEVPYMKGMLRRYDEVKDTAGSKWLKWATEQISAKRAEFQKEISTAQETRQEMLASAKVDETGKIVQDTLGIYFMAGTRIAVPAEDAIKAEPADKDFEQAGYDSLAAGSDPSPERQVQQGSESAPELLPGAQPLPGLEGLPAAGSSSGSAYASPDRNRIIAIAGCVFLAALIVAAVANQRVQALRRRSPPPAHTAEPGGADESDAGQEARLRRVRDAFSNHYSRYGDDPGSSGRKRP